MYPPTISSPELSLITTSSQRTQTSSIYKMATFGECVDFALKYSGLGDEHLVLKDKQIQTLNSLYKGRDCISILPTGYGKSVIFQLLLWFQQRRLDKAQPLIVLVVSTLNSLMQDQIIQFRNKNFKRLFYWYYR